MLREAAAKGATKAVASSAAPKSVDVAKSVDAPKSVDVAKSVDEAKSEAVAKTVDVPAKSLEVAKSVGVVVPTESSKPKPEKAPKKAKKEVETRPAWQEGIFAPAVVGAKMVMGEQQLKEFRAGVIAKHSKVIGNFVDTSEYQFGQLVLKRMFDYADKDGNGTLDKEEVRTALLDLGFDFLDEKQVEKLIKNADKDQN